MFMIGCFTGKTQSGRHEIEKTAIDFRAGNAEPAGVVLAQRSGVFLQADQQALGSANAPDRRTQLIRQPKDFCDVVIENKSAGPLQSQPRALRGNKRIAVAVAANPRSKP